MWEKLLSGKNCLLDSDDEDDEVHLKRVSTITGLGTRTRRIVSSDDGDKGMYIPFRLQFRQVGVRQKNKAVTDSRHPLIRQEGFDVMLECERSIRACAEKVRLSKKVRQYVT